MKKNHTYERSFVRFVLEPIHKVYQAAISNDHLEIEKIISKLNIHLEDGEKGKHGKRLFASVMRKWLPVANCILPMIISYLPSPIVAQKYRFDIIYDGTDDTIVDSIKNCQANGALFMYISKTLWTNDRGRRYAFGRIFSGRLKKGDKITIRTASGIYNEKVQ